MLTWLELRELEFLYIPPRLAEFISIYQFAVIISYKSIGIQTIVAQGSENSGWHSCLIPLFTIF